MDPRLFFDSEMMGHDPGPTHPESPARLRAIEAALVNGGLEAATPDEASPEALTRVHDPAYVDRILDLRDQATSLDPDTHVSHGSVRAALLAAGSAIASVDAVFCGDGAAFAMVRPPGHHAEFDRAMGFCLFNNVAVAAAHARAAHGSKRIAVIDWDVHHGNGTQNTFIDDPDLLFVSCHQYPHYPGSGAVEEVGRGEGRGFTVNVPFEGGCTDGDYTQVFDELIEPIVEQFAPELILVSAGFDAHRDDPLASMRLTDDGFATLCGRVQTMAKNACDGRLALLLEGGYNVDALARSVSGCIEVLRGMTPPPPARLTTSAGERSLQAATTTQREYWKLT